MMKTGTQLMMEHQDKGAGKRELHRIAREAAEKHSDPEQAAIYAMEMLLERFTNLMRTQEMARKALIPLNSQSDK